VKYVLAPNTRFERDHETFFGSKGEVAKGEPLINYGWGHGGLKEFARAYYEAAKGSTEDFETYYDSFKQHQGNLLERMSSEKLLQLPLRGLITARIHQNLFIPILVVDFKSIRFKYCENCVRRWEQRGLPPKIKQCLGIDKLSKAILGMRCTRITCNQLCGNYKNCILNYTSLEDDPKTEEKILDCLSALIRLLREGKEPSKAYECRNREATDDSPKKIGKLQAKSKCFERPVRFDFQPIRRRHVDPNTWKEIQDQRVDQGPHHIIDLIPADLLPDIYKKEIRRTEVSAPLEAMGVLQSFMKMADIKIEIKIDLSHYCSICGEQHRLLRLPISAMFKTDQAYVQEAGFGRMLWQLLWKEFPERMCKSYPRVCQIDSSPILKRELSISTLTEAEKNNQNYDYAVNLKVLTGHSGWLLFSLTTGLWKKGGFHEATFEPEKYVQYWKNMLVDIPSDLGNSKSLWYVVIPSTEEQFFDESAPRGVGDMNTLISEISDGKAQKVFKCKAVFNSTPRKGEARHELRKLEAQQQFPQTSIYPVLHEMLEEVE
jgi:hypothetical protein